MTFLPAFSPSRAWSINRSSVIVTVVLLWDLSTILAHIAVVRFVSVNSGRRRERRRRERRKMDKRERRERAISHVS